MESPPELTVTLERESGRCHRCRGTGKPRVHDSDSATVEMPGTVTLRLCLSPARRDFAEDKRADATLRRVFGLPGGRFVRHKKTIWYAVPDLPLGVAQSYVGLFRLFGVPDKMLEIAP